MKTIEIIRNSVMQCIEKIDKLAKSVVKISTLEGKTATLEGKTATLEGKTATLVQSLSETKINIKQNNDSIARIITGSNVCALHSIDDGSDMLFPYGIAELDSLENGPERYIIAGFPSRIKFYIHSKEIIFFNFDTSAVNDMGSMFKNCHNLTTLYLTKFNTSSVTNMSSMFFNCYNLTTLDVTNFDTSSVTDMSSMFLNCNKLTTLDVTNFDTSSVTDMSSMFVNCNKLTTLDVTNFDTSSVTDMSSMFNGCTKLITLDLTNFDTSSVTIANSMFFDCENLTSIIGTHTLEEVQEGTVKALRGLKVSISFSDSPNLERASILALFYGLADLTGKTQQTVELHATAKARLTAEDIKIATDKNWDVQ